MRKLLFLSIKQFKIHRYIKIDVKIRQIGKHQKHYRLKLQLYYQLNMFEKIDFKRKY